MGEAKRRKNQAVKDAVLSAEQKQWLYLALRKVINAIEINPLASCSATAQVGALALNELGVLSARAVAGSAVWRVGPGDADAVVHALECMPAGAGLYVSGVSEGARASMFHAWIAVGESMSEVVDFTTYSLRAKAELLDKADGMHTQVDWCPDFLWVPAKQCVPLRAVIDAYDVGVFGYRQDKRIQEEVLKAKPNELADHVGNVLALYRLYETGLADSEMLVMSIDDDGRIGTEDQSMMDVADAKIIKRTV